MTAPQIRRTCIENVDAHPVFNIFDINMPNEDCSMVSGEMLVGLRAGPITRAAAVKDSTFRAWANIGGLEIGDRDERDSGYPRYMLRDVATLMMMNQLTVSFGLSAALAVQLANKARMTITLIAMAETFAIDTPSIPEPERWMLILDRLDGSQEPEVLTYEQLRERGDGMFQLRVDLRRLVREARVQLVTAIGHSAAHLPYAFSDERVLA